MDLLTLYEKTRESDYKRAYDIFLLKVILETNVQGFDQYISFVREHYKAYLDSAKENGEDYLKYAHLYRQAMQIKHSDQLVGYEIKAMDIIREYRRIDAIDIDFKARFEMKTIHDDVFMKEGLFTEKFGGDTACSYCGITEEKISQLRGNDQLLTKKLYYGAKQLHVATVQPWLSYNNLENLASICHWCHAAKNDEFTDEEFRLIGQAIAKAWEKRG